MLGLINCILPFPFKQLSFVGPVDITLLIKYNILFFRVWCLSIVYPASGVTDLEFSTDSLKHTQSSPHSPQKGPGVLNPSLNRTACLRLI